MILHRDGTSRREETADPASVPEIAAFLRRERMRQGLSLDEVRGRTGMSVDVLQGLEAGTVDRLPDRVHTLQLLRRYADFLGLPGSQYVLVLVDHWPSSSLAGAVVSVHSGTPSHSATLAAARLIPPDADSDRPDDTASVPVVPFAGVPTATVGAHTMAHSFSSADQGPPTAEVPRVADATGPLPVVAGWNQTQRSLPSLALRVLVVLLAFALVAGIAGIVINETRPHWLKDSSASPGRAPRPPPPPSPRYRPLRRTCSPKCRPDPELPPLPSEPNRSS